MIAIRSPGSGPPRSGPWPPRAPRPGTRRRSRPAIRPCGSSLRLRTRPSGPRRRCRTGCRRGSRAAAGPPAGGPRLGRPGRCPSRVCGRSPCASAGGEVGAGVPDVRHGCGSSRGFVCVRVPSRKAAAGSRTPPGAGCPRARPRHPPGCGVPSRRAATTQQRRVPLAEGGPFPRDAGCPHEGRQPPSSAGRPAKGGRFPRGAGALAEGGNHPGARGTARATGHRPVVRMRQQQPHRAGDDVQPRRGLSRSSPRPWVGHRRAGTGHPGAPGDGGAALREGAPGSGDGAA